MYQPEEREAILDYNKSLKWSQRSLEYESRVVIKGLRAGLLFSFLLEIAFLLFLNHFGRFDQSILIIGLATGSAIYFYWGIKLKNAWIIVLGVIAMIYALLYLAGLLVEVMIGWQNI